LSLQKLSDSINSQKDNSKIISTVVSVSSDDDNKKSIKHVLYLLPIKGHGYNYRYIQFEQSLESYFPVKILAFQNGVSDFGVAENENEIFSKFKQIATDPRTKIIFDQLKSIGETIHDWKKERDTE
jgi:hypothetical protein